MFQSLRNSWYLVKASASVLRADKELLIFPFLSGVGSLLVLATFAVPMFLTGLFEEIIPGDALSPSIVGYVLAFAFYLVQYFVIMFANSALVGAAMIRLKGGDPTVGDGIRIAFQHAGAILGYALISATVGIILRALAERGLLGRIVSSLVGFAWNVATYLVVPVLVVEGVGPVEAVKRSASLLKRTWGEQIVGNFSINAIFGLLFFLIMVPGVALTVLIGISTESIAAIATLVIVLILVGITLGLVSSTLSGIYSAAVYRYAVDGDTSGYFEEELIAGAFRQK